MGVVSPACFGDRPHHTAPNHSTPTNTAIVLTLSSTIEHRLELVILTEKHKAPNLNFGGDRTPESTLQATARNSSTSARPSSQYFLGYLSLTGRLTKPNL